MSRTRNSERARTYRQFHWRNSSFMTIWRSQTTAWCVLWNWDTQFGKVRWCQAIQAAINCDCKL